MAYVLKDQSGRFLKITEYPHRSYMLEMLDPTSGVKPTIYPDSRDFLNGVKIVEYINEIRAKELNAIIQSGKEVDDVMLRNLCQIEVEMVEVAFLPKGNEDDE